MVVDSNVGFKAAALLTRWWSRPTSDELDAWAELWPEAFETAAALAIAPDQIEALRASVGASTSDTMLDEYERLLVGPGRPPCAPYESLWRADVPKREQGVLMGATADAVTDLYRELGTELRVDAHELPDHLLVEWEAVAYALDNDAETVAERLLSEHLTLWMGPFCHAISVETGERFYEVLAAITRQWTTTLAG